MENSLCKDLGGLSATEQGEAATCNGCVPCCSPCMAWLGGVMQKGEGGPRRPFVLWGGQPRCGGGAHPENEGVDEQDALQAGDHRLRLQPPRRGRHARHAPGLSCARRQPVSKPPCKQPSRNQPSLPGNCRVPAQGTGERSRAPPPFPSMPETNPSRARPGPPAACRKGLNALRVDRQMALAMNQKLIQYTV